MTLNLSEKEMEAVTQLSKKMGLNKTQLMRQCLRVYQNIQIRIERGERLVFEKDGKKASQDSGNNGGKI